MRVAIVGSGPAGFYAAGQLLGSDAAEFSVDVFDRLITPWGLVRAGVAPDHPKIKSVSRVYEKTARHERFRFHGNVDVGTDITHEQLAAAYDAVLYSVGSPTDRRLGIAGEDLPGSHAATEFVAWYNGHPDYAAYEFDLSATRAVVVGNGNVALDVARMLVLTPDELRVTDTADHAIEALAASNIQEVVVLGRRGPAQAAYTNPELLELADVHADILVDLEDTQLDPHSVAFLNSDLADLTTRRNVEIVTDYANATPAGKPKRIVLRFLTSPVEIVGPDRVTGVRVVRNELTEDLRARPTGDEELIEAGLVFRSIGYRGTPIPGVPFDDRARDDPQRRRSRDRPADRRTGPRRVRRGLDQARAVGRHRHEQEVRQGHRRAPDRGRRRRAPPVADRRPRRVARCSSGPWRRDRRLRGLGTPRRP